MVNMYQNLSENQRSQINKRIFIIFPQYDEKVHATKDPGIIADLLQREYAVQVLSSNPNHDPKCIYMSQMEICQGDWLPNHEGCTLIIFHGGKQYKGLIGKAKLRGHKVIIKADTDGHLAMSANPFSNQIYAVLRSSEITLKALLKHWRHTLRLRRWADKHSFFDVDAIILETMTAYKAFSQSFPEILNKLVMIPNGAFFQSTCEGEKNNTVIAVGRWDDHPQKNPELLLQAVELVSSKKKNWDFLIIGSYDDAVLSLYKKIPKEIQERINLTGTLPAAEVLDKMQRSKIILSTSRWESFSLVTVEALSRGCSVVCTPCAMEMQAAGGLLGNIAGGWKAGDVASALHEEMNLWEIGIRNSQQIQNIAIQFYDWHTVIDKIKVLL